MESMEKKKRKGEIVGPVQLVDEASRLAPKIQNSEHAQSRPSVESVANCDEQRHSSVREFSSSSCKDGPEFSAQSHTAAAPLQRTCSSEQAPTLRAPEQINKDACEHRASLQQDNHDLDMDLGGAEEQSGWLIGASRLLVSASILSAQDMHQTSSLNVNGNSTAQVRASESLGCAATSALHGSLRGHQQPVGVEGVEGVEIVASDLNSGTVAPISGPQREGEGWSEKILEPRGAKFKDNEDCARRIEDRSEQSDTKLAGASK